MKWREPIITSILDNDLYKFNMGSVVFHMFPRAVVTYKFINRGKTPFPQGFAKALNWQIELLGALSLTYEEKQYLNTIPYLRPTYVEWLSSYRFDPAEVVAQQDGDVLTIHVYGSWYRTIFWEVPLMAIISQLYFEMTGQKMDSEAYSRIVMKGEKLSSAECHWIDFGTRRRYSYQIQDAVVMNMRNYEGFLGTSNIHFAMKHGVKPHGTYAHECIMAMAALYGDFYMANHTWQRHWSDHFDGNVGVALTDTFTTDVFLRNFGTYEARLFDGVRQDSGDPMEWAIKMKNHYAKLGIDCSRKRFVFSDGLNTDKYITIDTQVRLFAQPVGGIGTHFTNDVGSHIKPLNMVIKMATADFGHGTVDVVKLSDSAGKHTGNPKAVAQAKRELRIV